MSQVTAGPMPPSGFSSVGPPRFLRRRQGAVLERWVEVVDQPPAKVLTVLTVLAVLTVLTVLAVLRLPTYSRHCGCGSEWLGTPEDRCIAASCFFLHRMTSVHDYGRIMRTMTMHNSQQYFMGSS